MSINRASKETGSLSGNTENVGARERWMRINHIMAALSVIRKRKRSKQICLGKKRTLSDENDVKVLRACLDEWVPALWKDDQPLINIATGAIAPIEMVDNIKNLQEMGTQDMEGFISRFTYNNNSNKKSYCDTIKRNKIIF